MWLKTMGYNNFTSIEEKLAFFKDNVHFWYSKHSTDKLVTFIGNTIFI